MSWTTAIWCLSFWSSALACAIDARVGQSVLVVLQGVKVELERDDEPPASLSSQSLILLAFSAAGVGMLLASDAAVVSPAAPSSS
jgi:hypothetical protein